MRDAADPGAGAEPGGAAAGGDGAGSGGAEAGDAGAGASGGALPGSTAEPGGAGAGGDGAVPGGISGADGTGGSGGIGAGGSGGRAAGAAGSEGPAELLGEVRAIRRRARLARHAYWFPLVLFGLLIGASVPFYIPSQPRGHFTYVRVTGQATYVPARAYATSLHLPGPAFLQSSYLGGLGLASYRGTAYYWLGAMLLGIAATVLWYRWRGNRVGLRTPARGYLITGLIIVAVALLLPLAAQGNGAWRYAIMPGDLLARGTFPFVLIGLGLCFLAWAERSAGLASIAVVYLALSLVASLYDIGNVFYNWFGLTLGPTASALPNVLLPALVLLLSGAGAWAVQRRLHAPVPED